MDKLLVTSTGVNDIDSNPCYVFIATTSGIDVFNPDYLENKAYSFIIGGCTSISVQNDRCEGDVYLGTNNSGVLGFTMDDSLSGNISGSVSGIYSYPDLVSNTVHCLSFNNEQGLAIGTSSGVTYITTSGNIYDHVFSGGVTSCMLTSSGDLYYSPTSSGVYAKYGPITSGWSSVDYMLNTSSVPALSGVYINDMEYKSTSSGNQVFLATNSGITMYDENRSNISGSYSRTIGSSLSGTTNVTGIEINTNTSVFSGSLLFSTYAIGYSGVVGEYDLVTSGVSHVYSNVDFQSTSGTEEAISGSKLLSKGE